VSAVYTDSSDARDRDVDHSILLSSLTTFLNRLAWTRKRPSR